MGKKRNDVARRFRAARVTASVGAIEDDVARKYGLPRACVGLRNPDGSDARSDKKIGTLLDEWQEFE